MVWILHHFYCKSARIWPFERSFVVSNIVKLRVPVVLVLHTPDGLVFYRSLDIHRSSNLECSTVWQTSSSRISGLVSLDSMHCCFYLHMWPGWWTLIPPRQVSVSVTDGMARIGLCLSMQALSVRLSAFWLLFLVLFMRIWLGSLCGLVSMTVLWLGRQPAAYHWDKADNARSLLYGLPSMIF